jgi:uncharacterized membrane protein HdeD (DUF308 family)
MSTKKTKPRLPKLAVVEYVKSTWWLLLLTAVLLVLIGLYALLFPGATISLFAAMFGWVLVVAGAISFAKGLSRRSQLSSIGLGVGLVSFVVGIYVLLYPVVFTEFLVFLFALILLIKSILALQMAVSAAGPASTWLVVSGVCGVVAATFLFVSPVIGGLAVLYVLGACAILLGLLGIADLITLRSKVAKIFKK